MIARLLPALRPHEGLTALETAAVLFVTAIVAVPLLAIAAQIVTLPVEWQQDVEAARDARDILRQVADDARQASCFFEEVVPQVSDIEDDPDAQRKTWTFTWVDYASSPPRLFEVKYDHRGDDVVREETVDEVRNGAAACVDEKPVRDRRILKEEKTIGSAAYFDIIADEGTGRCLVSASVSPSRPEDAPAQEIDAIQKIAAMMRPDNAQCNWLPQ